MGQWGCLTKVVVDVAVTNLVEGLMVKQEHALDSWDTTYVAVQDQKFVFAAFLSSSATATVAYAVTVSVILNGH